MRNAYLLLLAASFLFLTESCKETPEHPDIQPQITVVGDNPLKTGIYLPFVDGKVDVYDYDGLKSFYTNNNVDTATLGTYSVKYYAVALDETTAEAQRDVWVVVKPQSMATIWNVTVYDAKKSSITFSDSLTVSGNHLYINNLNDIEGAKIELTLASDLQDSVYIKEQIFIDNTRVIRGNGVIDKKAMQMELNYQIIENETNTHNYTSQYHRKIDE